MSIVLLTLQIKKKKKLLISIPSVAVAKTIRLTRLDKMKHPLEKMDLT